MEYYKLSILRKTNPGAAWQKFYIQFDGNTAKIIHKEEDRSSLNSKLEKITEEQAKKLINDSCVDLSYG
jgi:hypothetical protein